MQQAYVPYSRFPVAACLRSTSGRIHTGVNVENVAYPQSQCAEASAIGAMLTVGDREVAEVLVVAEGDHLIVPCGGCRQRLREFASADVSVYLCHPDGRFRTTTIGKLLPYAFGPSHLSASSDPFAQLRSIDLIRQRLPDFQPAVAIVLGSGLGRLADDMSSAEIFAYHDLPDFPISTVPGHLGRLVLGHLAGVPVMCLQGRVHLYEGHPAEAILPVFELIRHLGCSRILLTNASGSLRPEVGEGAICLITDHINLQGTSPLLGGPNFVGLTRAYDPSLCEALSNAAKQIDLDLAEGTYLATLGPQFETPAEIRAFRVLGADLVGMSTVAETIAARSLGLRVAALSAVTNLAAGMAETELSHEHTLAAAALAGEKLRRLITAALPDLAYI